MKEDLLVRAAKALRMRLKAGAGALLDSGEEAELDGLLERAGRGEAVRNLLLDLFFRTAARGAWLQSFAAAEADEGDKRRERAVSSFEGLAGAMLTSGRKSFRCSEQSCPWTGTRIGNTDPTPVCPEHCGSRSAED